MRRDPRYSLFQWPTREGVLVSCFWGAPTAPVRARKGTTFKTREGIHFKILRLEGTSAICARLEATS